MAKKQVLIINSDAAASGAFEAAKFGYVKMELQELADVNIWR